MNEQQVLRHDSVHLAETIMDQIYEKNGFWSTLNWRRNYKAVKKKNRRAEKNKL